MWTKYFLGQNDHDRGMKPVDRRVMLLIVSMQEYHNICLSNIHNIWKKKHISCSGMKAFEYNNNRTELNLHGAQICLSWYILPSRFYNE